MTTTATTKPAKINEIYLNWDIPTISVLKEGETEIKEICGEEKANLIKQKPYIGKDIENKKKTIGARLDNFLHRIHYGWYWSQIKKRLRSTK